MQTNNFRHHLKNRLLNILLLLTLLSVLSSFPAYAAIQEVNSTIEKNNFYKIDLPEGKYDRLTINVTANGSVDIFIFSEQDLIDYQVNGIIKPTHLPWFKLNTTSFFAENLTININPSGKYFIVVDNTDNPPNGAKLNRSVALSGEIVAYPPEIKINYWPVYVMIIIAISVLILYLLYIFIIRKKDAIQQSTFLLISVFILAPLISAYGYVQGFNYDTSIVGILSSLIQTNVFILLYNNYNYRNL